MRAEGLIVMKIGEATLLVRKVAAIDDVIQSKLDIW